MQFNTSKHSNCVYNSCSVLSNTLQVEGDQRHGGESTLRTRTKCSSFTMGKGSCRWS